MAKQFCEVGLLDTPDNAGAHNAIYRGKNLGSSYTAAQKAVIAAGTFDNLYVGDYWEIGNVKYRIAAFDYWYNCGDAYNASTNPIGYCQTHHAVIVPDTCLYYAQMKNTSDGQHASASDVTTGGYAGSDMRTTNLDAAKTTINTAFGNSNILTHREYLTNAVNKGYPSAGAWYDSTVDLMNERMVYGASVFTAGILFGNTDSTNVIIPTLYTIDKGQLPLFTLRPDLICNRADWWLRDVVSAAAFANVNPNGNATTTGASHSLGVRPAFAIC